MMLLNQYFIFCLQNREKNGRKLIIFKIWRNKKKIYHQSIKILCFAVFLCHRIFLVCNSLIFKAYAKIFKLLFYSRKSLEKKNL